MFSAESNLFTGIIFDLLPSHVLVAISLVAISLVVISLLNRNSLSHITPVRRIFNEEILDA
jgi:hypothetical protein